MDNLGVVFKKFFSIRTNPLWNRFPGVYRATVVETNDPLNMGRIRFKCPDLHDSNLRPGDCPWAVVAPRMGGKRAGSWANPCIGDIVWINFERGHPYGPICVGFATPTRRKYYPYPSISQPSPISVNDQGIAVGAPNDYNAAYLPNDGRPMSMGDQDRYGNLDIMSSVGFFPIEHQAPPPPPDFDPLQNVAFQQAQVPPRANSPDAKFAARITKYGHMLVMGDQGYTWQNEFTGNAIADEQFEINRWQYLQKLLNENQTTAHDQRNQLSITRYGHKFELRDTGWAQPGPIPSKSRHGEYGDPVYLSNEMVNDFRWAKLRTKGGWLMQAYDKGFDPQNDTFVKRLLLDETGASTEHEDQFWANKDARWFRIMGRYGFKFVIDERGTDPQNADLNENPRGNGALLKGRRTGGCLTQGAVQGDPRGYYWEFNENDQANHTTWGSPLGQAIEMNDATEYMCLAVGLGYDYTRPFQGLKENEFLLEPTRARNPENRAYHLVMDYENEYLRLKTRGGSGDPAKNPVNPTALGPDDLNQGLEARDGLRGNGPWVELVDSQHRGLWLSRDNNLSILRGKANSKLYVWLNDATNDIVIYNGQADGRVQVYCNSDITISSAKDVTMSGQNVSIKATNKVRLQAGAALLTLENGKLSTNVDLFGSKANIDVVGIPGGQPQPGGEAVTVPKLVNPPAQVEPTDRGAVYNQPSTCPINQIQHPIAG